MRRFVKDEIFRKQIQDVSEETKRYLNQLFLDLDVKNDEIVYHDPRKELFLQLLQKYKKKSHYEKMWTDKTNRMLDVLRRSL